ncbi:hypothetical protein B0H34DRAFT_709438 [Crassisporium funariophilum]|nr:hypothetical protein B0H34DRAFT_709438 [Crassisporium funariophilum]
MIVVLGTRRRVTPTARSAWLVVDGHNLHYTQGFLEHARANRIRVLCYPLHSTHVY